MTRILQLEQFLRASQSQVMHLMEQYHTVARDVAVTVDALAQAEALNQGLAEQSHGLQEKLNESERKMAGQYDHDGVAVNKIQYLQEAIRVEREKSHDAEAKATD